MSNSPLLSLLVSLSFTSLALTAATDSFHMEVVDRQIGQPWLKSFGDLDGDGDMDLLVGGSKSGGLVAYYNRFPHWQREVVDADRNFSTDGEVVDVNGDGKMDIVALTYNPSRVVWYVRSGSQWLHQKVSDRNLHDIEAADFDNDGQVDLVGRNQKEWPKDNDAGDKLYVYWQNRVDNAVSWPEQILECPQGEGLLVHDLDGDGDPDIIINQRWFENKGDRTWAEHVYAPDSAWEHPNTFIAVGDLNGDGRQDIVLTPSEREGNHYKVAWFEAPENRSKGEWIARTIVEKVEAVLHFVGVTDFDQDGRPDIASAEMPQGEDPDEVCVFFNRGKSGNGRWMDNWQKEVLSENGSHSMRIVDINGDGYPDLFGANWNARGRDEHVKVWVNRLMSKDASGKPSLP